MPRGAKIAQAAGKSAVRAAVKTVSQQVPVVGDLVKLGGNVYKELSKSAKRRRNRRMKKQSLVANPSTTEPLQPGSIAHSETPFAYGTATGGFKISERKLQNSTIFEVTLKVTPELSAATAQWGDPGYGDDQGLFKAWEFPINPLNARTWNALAQRLQNYKKYKIHRAEMSYCPSLPTSTSGSVALCFSSDPSEPLYREINTIQEASTSVVAPIYQPVKLVAGARLKDFKDDLIVAEVVQRSPTNGDYQDSDKGLLLNCTQGTIIVGCKGLPNTIAKTTTIGYLMLEVEIEAIQFSRPSENIGQSISKTLNFDVNLLGPLPEKLVKSIFWKFSPTTGRIYYLGPPQRFDVSATTKTDGNWPTPSFPDATDTQGNSIPKSDFDSFVGNNGPNTMSHEDFTVDLDSGDYLTWNYQITGATFVNLSLTAVPIAGGVQLANP